MNDAEWFDAYGGLTFIHGNIWRSPMPYTLAHFKRIRDAGIRVVFSFEEDTPGALAEEAGLEWRPHFWTDHNPPHPRQLDAFIDDYLSVPDDAPALMHCRAGWGRAGTAITSALVAKYGMSADEALKHYWSRLPDCASYMQHTGQAEFVRGYAARLAGRGL